MLHRLHGAIFIGDESKEEMRMLVKDVVCGMQVDWHRNETVYQGSRYAFCSTQCRDRFLAHPHLYIGLRGQRAPKQEGLEVLKRRRLRLAEPLSSSQAKALIDALHAMMGIRAVSVNDDKVEISYDLLEPTAEQIEAKMAEIGVQLGEGWTERLRRAFVHYEEECEISNLEVHEDKHIHGHK